MQHLAFRAGLLTLAAATPLFAQDSISSLPTTLPGDAMEIYVAAQNHTRQNYVVDLAPLTTSWGTRFRIGPIVKSGKSNSTFPNSVISAQAMSATLDRNVPYRAASYRLWTTPGQGLHPTRNSPTPGTVTPSGLSHQFAVAFAEFGTTDLTRSYNGIVGAFVNYDPSDTTRLFVQRISAATNGLSGSENRAQMGMGAVDSSGNVTFRADPFGATGPTSILGNNILRAPLAGRIDGTANLIDLAGIPQGDWLVINSATTHNTPSCVPESVAFRPVYIGSNFSALYLYEDSPLSVSSTTAHRSGSSDHRGGVSWSRIPAFSGSVGTGIMMGKDGAGKTRAMLAWGTDASGDVTSNIVAVPPASVTDPITGFSVDFSGEGQHHTSQTAFRGGNGQVCFGLDRDGNYLMATTMETVSGGGGANPFNGIVVAKLDSGLSVTGWSTAAYVDPLGQKKPIHDGSGAVIGELTELFNLTGGTPAGPSMTSPCMDSVGNLWFLSAVELFTAGPRGTIGNDFDSALIRAVYDRAAFGWKLELVLQLGDVFVGRNSGTPYRITFLGIADSDSISSGSLFSGNLLQTAMNGMDPFLLDERNPRTLGGLVVNAEITYDVDGDNVFDDTLGVDQSYNALLYVGPERQKTRTAATPTRTVSR